MERVMGIEALNQAEITYKQLLLITSKVIAKTR
mgnify:CR=1 FL=1